MQWEIGALTTDGPNVVNQQFSDGPFPGVTGYDVGNAAGAAGWEPVCMTRDPRREQHLHYALQASALTRREVSIMADRIEDRHTPRSTGGPSNHDAEVYNPQTRRFERFASGPGRQVHDDTTD